MLIESSEEIISISIIGIYLGILLLIAEILSRHYKSDAELTRKIVHLGSGNVILLAWYFNIPKHIIISASIVASVVAIISYILPILPSVNSVGRNSFGTLFYAMSIGILSALFWQNGEKEFTLIGILIMTYGDGLAGLIGQKFGKNKYEIWGNKKSREGTFTMMVVSFFVTLSVLGFSLENLIIAFFVGILATILETFSAIGIDNLTVPIICGIVTYYLSDFSSIVFL